MKNSEGVSFTFVIILGLLLSFLSLLVFFIVSSISDLFSPSLKNAEKNLLKGKTFEALKIAERIKNGENYEKIILKGKIFLIKSIRKQKRDGWKKYGTDSLDWLKCAEADSAIFYFKKALKLKKDSPEAMYFLGVIYQQKGWYDEAEDAFLEVLRIEPTNINARLALATIYSATDRSEDALEKLMEAYKLEPQNPDVSKNIAFLYRYYLEIPESATVWFNRFLNLTTERDHNVSIAEGELDGLLKKYRDIVPENEQKWKKKRRTFAPRHVKKEN
ncbi:MAG: tetratricopeptide repeat protein [Chitinispirillaceae bacterium]|nr:tetratricopeptide repeat protein [Chitinispirillaceae bacterium]